MRHSVLIGAGVLGALVSWCPAPARAQWFVRPYPFVYPAPVYPPQYYAPPPVYRPVYPPPVYAPPVYSPPVYVPPPPPRPSASLMEVQRLLADLGYDAGPADGLSGPRLSDAVQAFQRDHDMSQNGRLSGETIGAIREAARTRETQSVPAPAPSVPPTYHFNESPGFTSNTTQSGPRSTLNVKGATE